MCEALCLNWIIFLFGDIRSFREIWGQISKQQPDVGRMICCKSRLGSPCSSLCPVVILCFIILHLPMYCWKFWSGFLLVVLWQWGFSHVQSRQLDIQPPWSDQEPNNGSLVCDWVGPGGTMAGGLNAANKRAADPFLHKIWVSYNMQSCKTNGWWF